MKTICAQIIYKKHVAMVLLFVYYCTSLPIFGQELTNSTHKKKPSPSYLPNKLEEDETPLVDQEDDGAIDSLSNPVNEPLLVKPKPLKPISYASPDPLQPLDQLVNKQFLKRAHYIPFVQELSLGVECISLLNNTWNLLRNLKKHDLNRSYDYAGSLSILFRRNIQLGVEGGYAKLYPDGMKENKNKYKTVGFYGGVGIDYVSHYSSTDNLYAGLHYSSAYFTNHTLPEQNSKASSQNLVASWVELVLGCESLLLNKLNLYGGFTIRIGYLYDFEKFAPAENYVIPGYGINTNKFRSTLNLYILYKLSFIKRMIKFI